MRAVAGWVTPVIVASLLVAVVTWLVRLAEPKLAFFPVAGEDVTPKSFGIDYTPMSVTTGDGERLHVWHVPRADAVAQILYFHGNGGNLSIWADIVAGLWHQGFEVTGFDYRGYGLSSGRPSEQGLYHDVEAMLRTYHGQLRRPDVPIIYWGRSLGTAMAAYAARREPPDGVVLEAGFPFIRAVIETNPVLWTLSWLSTYRFPTAEWMSAVRQPTLVLHGDRDSIIRYSLGKRLYEALPGPKTFVTVSAGEHNDPVPRDPAAYWSAVKRFTATLTPSRTPALPRSNHHGR